MHVVALYTLDVRMAGGKFEENLYYNLNLSFQKGGTTYHDAASKNVSAVPSLKMFGVRSEGVRTVSSSEDPRTTNRLNQGNDVLYGIGGRETEGILKEPRAQ